MKIKNNYFAVSPARYEKEIDRIWVLPLAHMEAACSILHRFWKEEDTIPPQIAIGTNFYYTIEEFKSCKLDRDLISYERGVGRLDGTKDKPYLTRLISFEQRIDHRPCIGKTEDGFTIYEDDTYLIIGTYLPSNFTEYCPLTHSVVCTTNPGRPEPVQIEPNSLLGRTDDDIQSINREELGLILGHEHLVGSLAKTTAPILVGSAYFELLGKNSIISSDQFVCKPLSRRPRNKERGSIIFNDKENRFEGFDGTKWRPLKWADE